MKMRRTKYVAPHFYLLPIRFKVCGLRFDCQPSIGQSIPIPNPQFLVPNLLYLLFPKEA